MYIIHTYNIYMYLKYYHTQDVFWSQRKGITYVAPTPATRNVSKSHK